MFRAPSKGYIKVCTYTDEKSPLTNTRTLSDRIDVL